ncbi:MAG: T9SS type A sorting domain-containing protein [Ignavibacteria bacterium]|nr:T9SS type A sorting domain-containing protein [Ignavibacteria bacterium]
MLKKITILLFFIISTNVIAQNVTWEKFIPGRLYKDEWANDICQTTDGNFVVVGTSEGMPGNPNNVIEVVKINGYGDTLWIKKYHPPNTTMSRGKGCCSSDNGSSVITGLAGNANTAFLTKIDINGDVVWNKEYSSFGITYDGLKVQNTSDGGYIVNGLDFIMKTDSLGNHVWHKHILDYGFSNFISLTISHSDEYLVIYDILSNPYERGVAKFDDNGKLIWKKVKPPNYNIPQVIKGLFSNGYLLMGIFSETLYGPSYIFTFKMNEEGVFSSYKETLISNRGDFFDGAVNIINDNKFVFVTGTQPQRDTQYCTFRIIDSSGNILKTTEIISIKQSIGKFRYRFCHSVLPISNGYIMFAGIGQIDPMGAIEDFYVVRADSNLFFQTVGINNNQNILPVRFKLYQNFPNPFNPITVIRFDIPKSSLAKIIVYDILGREVAILVNENLKIGSYNVSWPAPTGDSKEYPSGVYFYSLTVDGKVVDTKKMILIK